MRGTVMGDMPPGLSMDVASDMDPVDDCGTGAGDEKTDEPSSVVIGEPRIWLFSAHCVAICQQWLRR